VSWLGTQIFLCLFFCNKQWNIILSYKRSYPGRAVGVTFRKNNFLHHHLAHYENFHIKRTLFWDVTPCSLIEVNQRFGGRYYLKFQGQMVSWTSNLLERSGKQILPFNFKDGRCTFPPKRRWSYTWQYRVISHNIVIFINAAVITSNWAYCHVCEWL
jgi:hypothetical protein